MSRTEFENKEWMIAVGSTAETGNFIQLWSQPHEELDAPLVIVDNWGITVTSRDKEWGLGVGLMFANLAQEFSDYKRNGRIGPFMTGESIESIAQGLGFDETTLKAVRKIFEAS